MCAEPPRPSPTPCPMPGSQRRAPSWAEPRPEPHAQAGHGGLSGSLARVSCSLKPGSWPLNTKGFVLLGPVCKPSVG